MISLMRRTALAVSYDFKTHFEVHLNNKICCNKNYTSGTKAITTRLILILGAESTLFHNLKITIYGYT